MAAHTCNSQASGGSGRKAVNQVLQLPPQQSLHVVWASWPSDQLRIAHCGKTVKGANLLPVTPSLAHHLGNLVYRVCRLKPGSNPFHLSYLVLQCERLVSFWTLKDQLLPFLLFLSGGALLAMLSLSQTHGVCSLLFPRRLLLLLPVASSSSSSQLTSSLLKETMSRPPHPRPTTGSSHFPFFLIPCFLECVLSVLSDCLVRPG